MCSGGATAARYAKETNDLREYTKAVDAARAAQQQEENNQVMGEIVGGFLTGFVGGVAGGAMRAPMTGAAAGVVMHPIIRPAIAAPRSVSVTRVNVRPNATVGTTIPDSVAVVPKQPTSSTSSNTSGDIYNAKAGSLAEFSLCRVGIKATLRGSAHSDFEQRCLLRNESQRESGGHGSIQQLVQLTHRAPCGAPAGVYEAWRPIGRALVETRPSRRARWSFPRPCSARLRERPWAIVPNSP